MLRRCLLFCCTLDQDIIQYRHEADSHNRPHRNKLQLSPRGLFEARQVSRRSRLVSDMRLELRMPPGYREGGRARNVLGERDIRLRGKPMLPFFSQIFLLLSLLAILYRRIK